MANTDTDSTIVRYTGDHELLFTDPEIIAVLAAPPFWQGTNQEGATTNFGKGNTVEETLSFSTGVSVGWSVGVELDFGSFTQSGFSAKVKKNLRLEANWTRSKSFETYQVFGSGSEDKVIFTSIPFDVYYYEIVTSEDPDVKPGDTMVISLPRKPQMLSVSRKFFNENNGGFLDIDESVLSHKISGDPRSYPNAVPRDVGWVLEAEEVTVCEGSDGKIETGISISEKVGFGTAADLSVSVEAEVKAGGVTLGSSYGFSFGYDYNIQNIENTFYEGSVPCIPDFVDSYSFLLYMRPFGLKGKEFILINYVVNSL